MSAPDGSGGGAFIPADKIYDELRRLSDAVIKLTSRLDQVSNQDSRITALERRVWWLSVAAAVAGAAINQVISG